jgi:hypothetical protein
MNLAMTEIFSLLKGILKLCLIVNSTNDFFVNYDHVSSLFFRLNRNTISLTSDAIRCNNHVMDIFT